MIDLSFNLRTTAVNSKQIAVCFLGQAGFIYKTASAKYIAIDPYLTDFCEHRIGLSFKRHIPILMEPKELEDLSLAAYLLTHQHEDHLDIECIQALTSDGFPFYAPPVSIDLLGSLGVAAERCLPLLDGSNYDIGDLSIHSVYADHGDLAPDAVGIIVKSNGKTIYHMGDTALREHEFKQIAERFEIDLLIVPINGKYGNMNETEAAKAVSILKPKYAVPCHYWALPGNSGGDPLLFIEHVKMESPETETLLFTQGEIFLV